MGPFLRRHDFVHSYSLTLNRILGESPVLSSYSKNNICRKVRCLALIIDQTGINRTINFPPSTRPYATPDKTIVTNKANRSSSKLG